MLFEGNGETIQGEGSKVEKRNTRTPLWSPHLGGPKNMRVEWDLHALEVGSTNGSFGSVRVLLEGYLQNPASSFARAGPASKARRPTQVRRRRQLLTRSEGQKTGRSWCAGGSK